MEIPVQLTLTLQTPNYNGHPAIAKKSQPIRKMHEEMTEINSRPVITDSCYFGNADSLTSFFFHYSKLFVQNPYSLI